jgi:DNA-binding beta-propeller fold protein YncE
MKRASTIRVLTVLCLLVVSAAAVLPAFLDGCDLSAPPKVMDLAGQGYRSPFDLAYGRTTLAVSDRTMGELVLIDSPAVQRHVKLQGQPTGLAWSGDGKSVLVSQFGAGSVAQVEAQSGKVVRQLPVGPYPMGVAVAPRKNLLVVAESGNDRLAVIDLATGQLKAAVVVGHSPRHVAVTSDEKLAVVTNLLPIGDASKGDFASSVSLVDLGELTARTIQLRSGSVNVRGVKVSPDGRWAYIVHTLGKFMLPATQLDRGWINTNAMTIIDLQAGKPYATVLLDLLSEGAADPWGLAIAKDGSTLWVALSGAQQVARIDLKRLHPLLEGKLPKPGANNKYDTPADQELAKQLALLEPYKNSGVQNTWADIAADPNKRQQLAYDLTALHVAGLMTRVPVGDAKGPRGIDVSPDGKSVAVAAYFSGQVLLLDAQTLARADTLSLGVGRKIDQARRGEMIFHDGTYCFQHWLSCASCHPDARADGLNWDLLNDGMGNPKNTKSLLFVHLRSPLMSQGVRTDMAVATSAGFKFILFRQPEDADVQAVGTYFRLLAPLPSPLLVNGRLNDKARRGRAVFEGAKANCSRCHSGPMLSDQKQHDVGTRNETDNSSEFVTPMLSELWRTAPYLHDGSAVTMRDVLTTKNVGDRHGATSHLSPRQLDELVEYLLSQ